MYSVARVHVVPTLSLSLSLSLFLSLSLSLFTYDYCESRCAHCCQCVIELSIISIIIIVFRSVNCRVVKKYSTGFGVRASVLPVCREV